MCPRRQGAEHGRAGDHDAVVALQLLDQPGAPDDLRVQALGRQEQDAEVRDQHPDGPPALAQAHHPADDEVDEQEAHDEVGPRERDRHGPRVVYEACRTLPRPRRGIC